VVDRSSDVRVWWLVAPSISDVSAIAGAIVPHEIAPFTAMMITRDAAEAEAFKQQLHAEGWAMGNGEWAAARKVLCQWPTLGREIDDKTLVQEVRFDELQGVKYDKGCFTGQETVARLHFRGHANRELQRLTLAVRPTVPEIHADGRVIGRITSWGILGEEIIALGMMRAERRT
jgi:folate-binding protein YgfZ